MIYLYSGTPGSGKSLHTAKEIRDRAMLGKPTIGNFEVNLSKFKRPDFTYCPNDQLTPDYLIRYSQKYFQTHRFKEGAILLVIDECQLIFNAREWQQTGRAQWLSFFTQHRKYGYNIILIAQFDRMIDRQIRSLIEYECIHRKASNYGIGGQIFSLAAGGNLFVCVTMWYPLKARIGSEFFHARKKYYSIYDSYSTFTADAAATGGTGAPEAAAPARKVRVSVIDTKSFILLRSFFTYYFTKFFSFNLPSGLPFWAGCTSRIHLCAYSFCCVKYFWRLFMSFSQWIKLYSECFRLYSLRRVRARFCFMTGTLKLDDSTLKSLYFYKLV